MSIVYITMKHPKYLFGQQKPMLVWGCLLPTSEERTIKIMLICKRRPSPWSQKWNEIIYDNLHAFGLDTLLFRPKLNALTEWSTYFCFQSQLSLNTVQAWGSYIRLPPSCHMLSHDYNMIVRSNKIGIVDDFDKNKYPFYRCHHNTLDRKNRYFVFFYFQFACLTNIMGMEAWIMSSKGRDIIRPGSELWDFRHPNFSWKHSPLFSFKWINSSRHHVGTKYIYVDIITKNSATWIRSEDPRS